MHSPQHLGMIQLNSVDNTNGYKTKKIAFRAIFWCAREDSNFHDLKRSPGPQPGASTNSATCA